ncbi:putative DNA binding domain-containing protein [bacterium]|nr:putative DNA binding domain-containing protein [bacterium]
MNEFELRERINKGEGFHLDFKQEMEGNNEFAKSVVSFANTDGGQIIIGITDDGGIQGVANIDSLMLKIDDIAFNRCEPPITMLQETLVIEGKTIVIANVPKGDQRPYRTQDGKYYIRSSNRCRQASREELLRIFQSSESIFYDEIAVGRSQYTDLNTDVFQTFLQNYVDYDSHGDEDLSLLLKNFHLLSEDKKPTVTGLLFFGKNPQNYLPASRIICAFIRGNDIAVPPSDKKELVGRIPDMLDDARKFLKLYLTEKHVIKGFEPETIVEIPEVALREAVVNAIAHRDYTINAPIRVIVYEDRVEIRSPGKLPNTVTIESMKVGGSHVLRNPTIYNLLVKMKMVTDMGSGVRRIIKTIKGSMNRDVALEATESEFVLTLPRRIE